MTRAEAEDRIIDLVKAGVPRGVTVRSIDARDDDTINRLRRAAVFVYYAGCAFSARRADYLQKRTMRWMIICASKSYRDGAARDGALDLLEAVEASVVGELVGGRRVEAAEDSPMPTVAPGVMSYALTVKLDNDFRKDTGG